MLDETPTKVGRAFNETLMKVKQTLTTPASDVTSDNVLAINTAVSNYGNVAT
jgi:hypothetical protein